MIRIIAISTLEDAKREIEILAQEHEVVSKELNAVESENFRLKEMIKKFL